MTESPSSRRHFLRQASTLAAAGVLPTLASQAHASYKDSKHLALFHTHTRESINLIYAVGEQYITDALGSLNLFLRDHYTGSIGRMDPQVYDLLHRVRLLVGSERSFEIISGYREPATNLRLRTTRGGGVAKHSLHTEGRAIDVRLPGTSLSDLRDAALSLRAGGVGYYPRDQFVHIDTGRVRSW
ncbi:MAG: DUF882 domain-containing protein [Hydrogenophaga sp.]|uniref:YcbK family protein n=1 Tax=Hydrogenophaga sp. TaxID=1904254 RepID=UPI001BC6A18F|nr:DUF882 domain-containing protein [Hydrogenophaga sp.]MBS3912419.1 DUF882 domain-containing protein [Hydrogenophaga sp.]MDO9147997.1 DUF882 domain-containing protein [Hydrogenophaga sp.]MDO9603622.1 DUF882 domain-containing protein [Hydrogenophaga sp.]MDP2166224.1 DUF882 domain-containing protein [Hydrogenophaga sp.]MDP3477940.1 DUF882 domain-containing protein [Hydrogenophaga sp.]